MKQYRLSICILVVSLIAVILIGVILVNRGISGFNLNIYNYFASFYYHGQNPYNVPDVVTKDINETFRATVYLDYTGFQQAIYNLCFAVQWSIWWKLNGFLLYSLGLITATMLSLYTLQRRALISTNEYVWVSVLIFAPYTWYVLFIRSFEDKIIFMLLPPFILLARAMSCRFVAWSLGVLTGLVGVPGIILPVLVIDALQSGGEKSSNNFRRAIVVISFFGFGLMLAMIPYFPDALIGWTRRAALENGVPRWFSVWQLIGGAYSPGLNKLIIGGLSLWVYVLSWRRKLSFAAAVVVLLSFPFFFSISMESHRLVPVLVMLPLAFETARVRGWYSAGCFCFLLLFLIVDVRDDMLYKYPATHVKLKTAFLCAPAIMGYGLLFMEYVVGGRRDVKSSSG
ncbi:MAG: hypothetical protein WCI03_01055 [bacterium]